MITTQRSDVILKYSLILLAIFIQQSSVIAGVNISIGDFIAVVLLLYFMIFYTEEIKFNTMIKFMLILFAYRLIVTFYFIMYGSFISVELKEILASTIKFACVALYFLLAYTLFKIDKYKLVFIKAYIYSSTLIGMICIIGTQLKAGIIINLFFADEIRSKGLMNDPNYFAMTLLVSLIITIKFIKNSIFKMVISVVLIGSIFTTGSKTALIILILLVIFYIVINIFSGKIFNIINILLLSIVSLIFIFIFTNYSYFNFNFNFLEKLPSIDRMVSVFKNGTQSINNGGSDRSIVWMNAISLIKYSLGFGIGLLDYVHVSKLINGVNLVAHNTYLQIIIEWGLLFSAIFIGYLLYILSCLIVTNKNKRNFYLICIMLVLLMYFMTVSFNNSRYVAFIIGIFAFVIEKRKGEKWRS